jgi:hypothetical protein
MPQNSCLSHPRLIRNQPCSWVTTLRESDHCCSVQGTAKTLWCFSVLYVWCVWDAIFQEANVQTLVLFLMTVQFIAAMVLLVWDARS